MTTRKNTSNAASNYVTTTSKTCDGIGLSPISKDECRDLSKSGKVLKAGRFKHEHSGGRPFGCFAEIKDGEGEWYFNSRSGTGKSCERKATCICKGKAGADADATTSGPAGMCLCMCTGL